MSAYRPGTHGYDISYPQCEGPYPALPYEFVIVGVAGGKAFTQNRCLFDEFFGVRKQTVDVGLYMNLNYPSGTTISFGNVGPKGVCSRGDEDCRAYNYGYNAASAAYRSAHSQLVSSRMWWLDIELENTWSDTVSLNTSVLQGALDFFTAENIRVGIYSTYTDWPTIMGKTFIPMQRVIRPVPFWIGGATETTILSFCLDPFFSSGTVWLVQYERDSFDGNYVCL